MDFFTEKTYIKEKNHWMALQHCFVQSTVEQKVGRKFLERELEMSFQAQAASRLPRDARFFFLQHTKTGRNRCRP
jgi:hypothetical protein